MFQEGKPLLLLGENLPGLAQGAAPEELVGDHPLWAEAIASAGPWHGSSDGQGNWQSTRIYATGIVLCRTCASALDLAWKLWDMGRLSVWDAVIAGTQWAGRGQVRRPWSSLPGNLHVAWRPMDLPSAWDPLASLIPAWLAARTLARIGGWDIRVKWPNDLLWQDAKVGGILVEQRGGRTLAGMGLNLAAPPRLEAAYDSMIGPGAMNGRIDPVSCWISLVSENISWYQDDLPRLHPEVFLQSFSSVLAWKGRCVRFSEQSGEEPLAAVLLGIDGQGGLMVSVNGKKRTLASGDYRLCSRSGRIRVGGADDVNLFQHSDGDGQ